MNVLKRIETVKSAIWGFNIRFMVILRDRGLRGDQLLVLPGILLAHSGTSLQVYAHLTYEYYIHYTEYVYITIYRTYAYIYIYTYIYTYIHIYINTYKIQFGNI